MSLLNFLFARPRNIERVIAKTCKQFLIDLEEEKKLYIDVIGGASFITLIYIIAVVGFSL